jgi:hypothetical protein
LGPVLEIKNGFDYVVRETMKHDTMKRNRGKVPQNYGEN